jgi:D-xylose 1-dehydrogenase (NADP+, D-xylono-1,5-lactone-forming)
VLPAIQASRNGRLVSISSRQRDRAEKFAADFGIASVAADYDGVLEDPEVDAVYIPLVNHLHLEWTLRCFEAGKHVLCEKPLGMNAHEAEQMKRAAEKSGLLLMEAFMYRFHPRARQFVESVREKDVLHVHATFGFPLDDDENVRMKPELGGGALLDVGCYTLNVARWILGEPVSAQAQARRRLGVDVTTAALLSFEAGATASLWCSFESAEEQRVIVIAKDGTSTLERPFSAWRDPHDPYLLMVESFADSVLEEKPVALPLDDSVANMRGLDRIKEAADV